jgi:hypothetical protein
MNSNKLLLGFFAFNIILLKGRLRRYYRDSRKPSPIPETLIKYKCNYVQLLGTDDQIRMFLLAIIKPEHKEDFIDATSDILKNVSPSCYDGFINKNLTKEQAILLYTTMNYFSVYFTLADFDKFSQAIYDSKHNDLLKFLGLTKDQYFQNKYNSIINALTHERFYTI